MHLIKIKDTKQQKIEGNFAKVIKNVIKKVFKKII